MLYHFHLFNKVLSVIMHQFAVCPVCSQVLSQPQYTAEAALEATRKKRASAEEDVKQAVMAALHFMNCLKEVLPFLVGEHSAMFGFSTLGSLKPVRIQVQSD